ncbi:hypothetical protein ACFYPG_15855 [Micromonospora sp. NPDC005553]|uniref:hypothetical protein n=1 Tax=Micromonospora sp. NPDC005553 TaxID=3364232 RepID=UPI0036BB283D
MSLTSPLLVPLVGLLGVFLGGGFQMIVARTNRLHERRVALEMRRAETRLDAYVRLIQFVAEREHQDGRRFGMIPADEVLGREQTHSKAGDDQPPDGLATPIDTLVEAQLLTFGGPMLPLTVTSWSHARSQAHLVKITIQTVELLTEDRSPFPEIRFDDSDLDRLHAAEAAAIRSATRAARIVLRQVQAELAGDMYFRPYSRLRGRIYRKREHQRAVIDNEFVEEVLGQYKEILDPIYQALSTPQEEDASGGEDAHPERATS